LSFAAVNASEFFEPLNTMSNQLVIEKSVKLATLRLIRLETGLTKIVFLNYVTSNKPMNISILSAKGQILIPKRIRETEQFSSGDEFAISVVKGEIRLRPLVSKKKIALDQVAGCLARPEGPILRDANTKAAIEKLLKLKANE
jgi:AbrB family looped-hinge helix DNA binding protein